MLDNARAIADAGADELVVHARTKLHGYRPPAYWDRIAQIREAVRIPVVANGEIWSVDDARRCIAASGCDALMLGRGMVADPGLALAIRGPHGSALGWPELLPLLKRLLAAGGAGGAAQAPRRPLEAMAQPAAPPPPRGTGRLRRRAHDDRPGAGRGAAVRQRLTTRRAQARYPDTICARTPAAGTAQGTAMQYRSLGKSPLKVSALCLGTMMFADQTELAEARNIVAHAHEHGVNFIDTADVYAYGKSEAMVGELLKAARATTGCWPPSSATRCATRPERIALLAHLARARMRGQPAAPGHRPHRHLLPAPRLQRHGSGRAAARHRAPAARRQDPLLGPVELSRLAHRRGGAHGARDQHARAGGLPALLQPAQPPARGRSPAGLRALTASAWCRTARSRAACWPASTRRAPSPAAGTRAGARRQAHHGDRVPRRVAGHRASAEGALRAEGRRAGALRHAPGCWRTRPSAR